MKNLILILVAVFSVISSNAKTLIVYYSFTNNVHTIVSELQTQISADVVRIEPAEDGVDYAANNYAIGSAQIAAIRNNPNDISSYPEIKPVNVNLDEYDMVIIAVPLWWSNMAAPLQTYLFHNGAKMVGKKIGLIVSSASSEINGVESDMYRLIPDGDFLTPSLWIRSAQTSNCRSMLSNWLEQINYVEITNSMKSVVSDTPVNMNVISNSIYVDGEFNSLKLYNLSGRKMLESCDNPISTSSLIPGVYIVQINANSQSVSNKITITK